MMKIIRAVLVCLSLSLVSGFVYAGTIHVDDDNTAGPWDGTQGHPYQYIQDGIDAAVNGDTVLVADGIYTGSGNVNLDFGGKAITVESENGTESCIIDCQSMDNTRGFYFHSGESSDSIVDGFTVQNGRVLAAITGGGILCSQNSSPTIINNTITGNRAVGSFMSCGKGGGISCIDSSPTITGNTIWGNRTAGGLVGCSLGGGIHCEGNSSPMITSNIIVGNSAHDRGGGISCDLSSSPIITDNVIASNSAAYGPVITGNGGGISCSNSSPMITSNIIAYNWAYVSGGGIDCSGASPEITNNIITGNSAIWHWGVGGGISCSNSSPKIISNTFAENSADGIWGNGGGIYCRDNSSPTIANTIFWSDSPQEVYFDASGSPNTVTVSYSDVQGGEAGIVTNGNGTVNWLMGNIDADPLFVDAGIGNYHLSDYSPCIGAGIMTPDVPDSDLEGTPRPSPSGSNPDMGAYENSGSTSYIPDISVSPPSWDYGDVSILGGYIDMTFVVSNPGTAILSVTATNLTGDIDFTIQSGAGSFSLNPGETHDIVIRFAPWITASRSATLSLVNNVSGKNPLNVPLQGTGILTSDPDILAIPSSWDYGDVSVGSYSDKTFVVSNPGGDTLNVTATNLTGDIDFSIYSGNGSFDLNPGETHDIVIRFMPSSTGSKSATLSLPNNVSGKNPLDVPLQGVGEPIDNTPPPAPIALNATPSNWTNTNFFSIDWTNPSDPSGIDKAYYMLGRVPTYDTDGTWSTLKPFPVAASEGGQVIYVWLMDGAGNIDHNNRSSTMLYYDATAPNNPTSCAETHGVQNGVTQSSVSDPNFTWSGASDSASGVDGYYYYWGTNSSGTSSNYTTTAGYDPPSVSPGTYYLRVKTKDNAGNEAAAWLTIFTFIYTEPSPVLYVSTTDIDLGTHLAGYSFSSSFIVRNDGGGTLSGSVSESVSWITSLGPASFSRTAGQQTTISFSGSFPSTPGSFSTNISVTSNGGNQNVYVHGVVQEPSPVLYVSPTDIDLGTHLAGYSFSSSFIVRNDGGGTLSGSVSESVTWITSLSPASFSRTAGQQTTISFSGSFPSTPGSFSTNISVTSNGGNQNVYVHGVVQEPSPVLYVSPTDIDLGSHLAGYSFSDSFIVRNDGGGTLSGSVSESVSWITSLSPTSFSRTAGQQTTISFSGSFPSTPGSFSTNISVTSNGGNQNVYVHGVVQEPSPVPYIGPVVKSPQPPETDFWVDIQLGSDADPVNDLFGVSFVFQYTNTGIIDAVDAQVVVGGFLGSDLIYTPPMIDDSAGTVSIGVTRKLGSGGVTGYGTVARVKMRFTSGAPCGNSSNLSITDIVANDPNGAFIDISAQSAIVEVSCGILVWPGDNNNDGRVNQADVLPIGLHWHRTGPARVPQSIVWEAFMAQPWDPVNATYADANGSGKVDQADVLPIGMNWGKEHGVSSGSTASIIASASSSLSTVFESPQPPETDFWVDIQVGSESAPVSDLFGISFVLQYTDTGIIDAVDAQAVVGGFLGSDLVYIPPMIDDSAGTVAIGITRKLGSEGVSGYGTVARMKLRFTSGASCGDSSNLTLTEIIANDSNGAYIELESEPAIVQVACGGQVFQLELQQGWNLVSLPLDPVITDPGTVLSSLGSKYNSIWAYDPTSGWSMYAPGAPSDLQEMVSGKGYWIEMNDSETLLIQGTVPESTEVLLKGAEWNLAGYCSLDREDVENCNLPDCISSVWEYSADTGWSIYAPGWLINLETMKPGFGYWIKVREDHPEDCVWNMD